MYLLEIKNLFFRLGGQTIFDGVDLALDAREIHALVGTNGSGKSSLAYVILV
jgi:Fe-S cluster assembly ATP-binding protein